MPNPIMKSFAKKADTTVKRVEKLWNKSEKLVMKKYDLTPQEDSDRFYALVVSVLKKILKIDKPKEIIEDEGVGDAGGDSGEGDSGITTSNLGAYQYYSMVGWSPFQRGLPMTSKEQKKIEKASTKKVDDKELAKRIKKIVAKINEDTSVIDEFLDYYNSRYDDVDYVVEKSIEMVEKKIGLVKSGLDK